MTFDDWYKSYPKKIARADAEKAWRKMSEAEQKSAIESLPAHVQYWNACGTERQYMPHPATWLRGKRWEDEIEMPDIPERVVAWWATDAGVLAKGREIGCMPRPGEDMMQYKARVVESVRRAA